MVQMAQLYQYNMVFRHVSPLKYPIKAYLRHSCAWVKTSVS